MGKTSIDAKRHMRQLGEFFYDMDRVGIMIVEELIRSHKEKKYLRQSLNRLIEKGYIQKKDGNLVKTKLGCLFFNKQKVMRCAIDGGENKKWYVLSFDIPIKDNSKRDALRWVLKRFGFFQLQRSVWIGTNKLAQDVWEFIVENRIEKYCFPMIVEIIEGEERLLEKIKRAKA
jgi:DNA-binding transcriptional regulator PaaX